MTLEWVAAALVCALLALVCFQSIDKPVISGDTRFVVKGASQVLDCLHDHVYSRCEYHGPPHHRIVGAFPLLQYIPATIAEKAGMSQDATVRLLIAIDALALSALIAVGWITVRRFANQRWSYLFVIVAITAPLWYYAVTSFGEALAAALIVFAVASVLWRVHPVLVAVSAAAASITKETNPIFVAALVVVCILCASKEARDASKSCYVAAGVGIIAGIAANALFNEFRFGTVRNVTYLKPYAHVHDAGIGARNFAGLWFAPNAGLLWFWPLAIALFVVLAVALLRRWRHPTTTLWLAGVVLIGTVVANQLGLALWYAPFGWLAWGPRLSLTVVPPAVMLACVLGPRLAPRIPAVAAGRAFIVTFVFAAVAGLAQLAVIFKPRPLGSFFRSPECVDAHVNTNAPAYYHCLEYLTWHKRPFMLQVALRGLTTGGGVLASLLLCAAVAVLLLLARREPDASEVEDETLVRGDDAGASRDVVDRIVRTER